MNKVSFVKWQNQLLPTGLTLTIELYVAYSGKWLYDQVEYETDERVYDLYNRHTEKVPPEPISLLDCITGERKIRAVRGANCDHLKVSYLLSYSFFEFLRIVY